MNAQLTPVFNQLLAIGGISASRLAGFQATRTSLEAKMTPSGIPGPGLADAPVMKLLESEINTETHIQQVIGGLNPPTGLILTYLNWDQNDNNRAALGLEPQDPEPIPEEIVKYASTVVSSMFGVAFTLAPLPKGSAPGSTSMNPAAPPGGNSPWGLI